VGPYCGSILWVHIRDWGSIVGVHIGGSYWGPILGVHIRGPYWGSILGVHIGCPIAAPRLRPLFKDKQIVEGSDGCGLFVDKNFF
jgi:hypothetical protein